MTNKLEFWLEKLIIFEWRNYVMVLLSSLMSTVCVSHTSFCMLWQNLFSTEA